jgi:hypothetical protein
MTMRSLAAASAVLLLSGAALAGDAITGFSHDNKGELFGYYLPPDGTQIGHYELHDFAIGPFEDLKKWETGKKRMATYAPVMFQFTDLSSKLVKNEESGQMEHENEVRVLPSAYRIKGNTIAFVGSSKEMGAVTFVATMNLKEIGRLNAINGTENAQAQSSGDVMKGDLTVGGKTFKGIGFSWFAGE